jgi:hypothetical protein
LEEDVHEQDANTSRLLGSTYTFNRIGSFVDWQHVLKRLGDVEAATQVEEIRLAAAEATTEAESWNVTMDSVKRKRKKKMNKHIFKKRRKVRRLFPFLLVFSQLTNVTPFNRRNARYAVDLASR